MENIYEAGTYLEGALDHWSFNLTSFPAVWEWREGNFVSLPSIPGQTVWNHSLVDSDIGSRANLSSYVSLKEKIKLKSLYQEKGDCSSLHYVFGCFIQLVSSKLFFVNILLLCIARYINMGWWNILTISSHSLCWFLVHRKMILIVTFLFIHCHLIKYSDIGDNVKHSKPLCLTLCHISSVKNIAPAGFYMLHTCFLSQVLVPLLFLFISHFY